MPKLAVDKVRKLVLGVIGAILDRRDHAIADSITTLAVRVERLERLLPACACEPQAALLDVPATTEAPHGA